MRKQFKNPPILEAVLEVNFPNVAEWNDSIHGQIVKNLTDKYSGRQESFEINNLNFKLSAEGHPELKEQKAPRFRLWKPDNTCLVQFGPDTCVLNILPKYTKFEDYLPEFESLLFNYFTLAKPNYVNWMVQRYINRIELPSTLEEPSDYFNIYPRLPKELTERNPNFALQVQVMNLSFATITVNLQFQEISNGKPAYVLDIIAKSTTQPLADYSDIIKWNKQVHEHLYDAFACCLNENNAMKLFD